MEEDFWGAVQGNIWEEEKGQGVGGIGGNGVIRTITMRVKHEKLEFWDDQNYGYECNEFLFSLVGFEGAYIIFLALKNGMMDTQSA